MVSLPCWLGHRADICGPSSSTSPNSWNFSSFKGGQGEVGEGTPPTQRAGNVNIPTTTANEHKPRGGHVILKTSPPGSDQPGSYPHLCLGKLSWRERRMIGSKSHNLEVSEQEFKRGPSASRANTTNH